MNSFCVGLLEALLRSGLALTLSATFVLLFLRYVPVASPRIRRLAFFAVVLQGCLLVRIPVTYFAAAPQKAIASQAIESEVERSQAIRQLAFEIAEAVFTNSLVPTVTAKPLTAATRFPLVAMVLGLWTLGIVVLFGRSLWHYVRFIRQLSFCAETPAEWEHEWKTMQQQCGSRHRVALRLTEAVGPLVCWHPRGYQLIVPVEVWRLLTSRQRLLILRHELAHLQRGDIWKSLVIRLMALAHWFNPLVWWMVRRFDEDAECSCDDAVRNSGPKIAIDYARTLLLLGGSHGSTFLTTQAASGPGLADRIRRMIVPTPRKDSNMKKILIATMVFGISTLHLLRIELKADDKPAVEPVTAIDGGVNLVVETAEGDGVHIQADRAIVFRENSSAKVPTNRTEAVVDVRQVMENLTEYHQRRESLKSRNSKMMVELAAKRYSAAQKPMPLNEAEFAELEKIEKRISEDLLQKGDRDFDFALQENHGRGGTVCSRESNSNRQKENVNGEQYRFRCLRNFTSNGHGHFL